MTVLNPLQAVNVDVNNIRACQVRYGGQGGQGAQGPFNILVEISFTNNTALRENFQLPNAQAVQRLPLQGSYNMPILQVENLSEEVIDVTPAQ